MACYLHSTYNLATVKKLCPEMEIFWQTFCRLCRFVRAEADSGVLNRSNPKPPKISIRYRFSGQVGLLFGRSYSTGVSAEMGSRMSEQSAAKVARQVVWHWPTILLNFMVIWILNAELVPGINESHYLTKAKHAWNPEFAPSDLFLSSGNAHWSFSLVAGWMSTWMPLPAVAWLGRIGCWLLMSIAWQRCAARLHLTAIHAACVLAGWMLGTRLGNWAGEWAIGGFEGKAIAYPLIALAMASMLENKWPRVWLLCGVAVAFHPLVGGWAGLTLFGAWLWWGRDRHAPLLREFALQLPMMGAAGIISLVGIAPALAMIGGPAKQGDIVVAQIHAFYRLAHHQTPHLFWASQHIAGAFSLGMLIVSTGLLRKVMVQFRDEAHQLQPAWRLMCLAWLAVGINAIGLAIDLIGVQLRPDLAASLLRFYWFRWADIIVPLAWICGLWSVGLYLQRTHQSRLSVGWHTSGLLITLACSLSLVGVVCQRVSFLLGTDVAPADRTLLMSESSQLASSPEVAEEWIAVCNWIRLNTPPEALFLTPRAQQTFKWYAERAEVVTFKDVPQDSQSLLEWYDRIGRCAPPRDANLQPLGWSTEQIKRLQRRYKFQYVVVDRRIQTEAPLLQLVYPEVPAHSLIDGTYAVFKLP